MDSVQNKFIKHVSHEFKTPLATVRLAVNYLLKYRHKLSDEVIEEKLQQILEQTNLLVHSVDNISKIKEENKEKLTISKQRIDLNDLLTNEIREAEKRFAYSHKIEFQAIAPVIEVESDRDILHNVFVNLLSNAIKFSPGKEKIWANVTRGTEKVKVEIRDEGIGIAEDELDAVFQSFYRGRNAATFAGMGLGLSIVRQGMEMLNGDVTIKSKVDEGTSFFVEFYL